MKYPLLDEEILEQLQLLSEDEPAFWADLLEVYLRDAQQLYAELAATDAGIDCAQAAACIHKLKGSSANVGAARLAGALADMEVRLRELPQTNAWDAAMLTPIAPVWQETMHQLEQLLDQERIRVGNFR